jgi:ribonuclease VapC
LTLLIDASALVAIATGEPDAEALVEEIRGHSDKLCCSVGIWETARAIARKRTVSIRDAGRAIEQFCADFDIRVVAVGAGEASIAIDAHDRYGKGTGHPAQLNMGDCFAYACAKANDARLLYKGDDFSETDLAR